MAWPALGPVPWPLKASEAFAGRILHPGRECVFASRPQSPTNAGLVVFAPSLPSVAPGIGDPSPSGGVFPWWLPLREQRPHWHVPRKDPAGLP